MDNSTTNLPDSDLAPEPDIEKEPNKVMTTDSHFFSFSFFCSTFIFLSLLSCGAATQTKTAESVIFHPVEQIQTSKTSWIISSAIDLGPYSEALANIRHYSIFVRN